MKKTILLLLICAGCGTPAYTSAIRPSVFPPTVRTEVVCDESPRSSAEMTARMHAHAAAGAQLVYVSEYTSSATPNNQVIMCFEQVAR